MKKYLKHVLAIIALASAGGLSAEVVGLASPDGKLKAEISTGDCFTLSAALDGKQMLKSAKISLKTPRRTVCSGLPYSLDRRFHKSPSGAESFNQLEFSYTDAGYKVYVRAYNNAIAYCVELKKHPATEIILDEQLEIETDRSIVFPAQELPAVFTGSAQLGRVALLETDDPDYPKIKIKVSNRGKLLSADFKKIKNTSEFEPAYIYRLDGRAKILPWRAFTPVAGYADENIGIVKARLQSADLTGKKKL